MTDEPTAEGVPVSPIADEGDTNEAEGAPVAVEGEPVAVEAEGAPVAVEAEGAPPEKPRRRPRRKSILLLGLLALLAMLTAIVVWYLLFRQPIAVLPLPGIPATQVPTYVTAVYGAQRPSGVAVSPSGDRIYVVQSAGDRTGIVFDASGNKVGTMAPPAATGSDHTPVYVAIDPLTGEAYVSDRPAGTIYVYDRDGAFQREFRLAVPRPGWEPLGLAFDARGYLYVTDLSGPFQKVLVIDRAATVVRTLGENDALSFPNGVAADGAGNVYVADSNNGRLLMYDASGVLRAQVGRGSGQGNLGLPRGLAVDGQGRVFVADSTGQGVFVFRAPTDDSRSLVYLGFFGGEGVGDGTFRYPNSVAADARGRIYVVDAFNDRVQIWSY
jgi:DNA-binding beta-propeller fold protein YncE